jgi:hypothetical protein
MPKSNFLKIILLLLFFFSIGTPVVKGQHKWNIVHTDYDGRFYYCFDGLSCVGNVCTASGMIADEFLHHIRLVFWRSTDGGGTWKEEAPELPGDSILNYGSTFFTGIEQIDSLHTFAIGPRYGNFGDSSIILHTTNGGIVWTKYQLPFAGVLTDIQFCDTSNGILLAKENLIFSGGVYVGMGPARVFTTTDGGVHWDSVGKKFPNTIRQCHVFKNGSYCLFESPTGRIYSTHNSWSACDSTSPIIINDTTKSYYFYKGSYIGKDSVIAYGTFYVDKVLNRRKGLVAHSTDLGNHWSSPDTLDSFSSIQYMSNLERDTILAGGVSINKMIISTDRGLTWRTDSLFLDTDYLANSLRGIEYVGSGKYVAIYTYQEDYSIPSVIIKSNFKQNSVERSGLIQYNHRVYPNPVNTNLNIASVEAPTPYRIIDLMGRVVRSGMVGDNTDISIDVSALPNGIYFVFVDDLRDGHPVNVGKIMKLGN